MNSRMRSAQHPVKVNMPHRHHPVQIFFLAALAVCALMLTLNLLTSDMTPGNAWRIGYGVSAAVLLVSSLSYGIRRRAIRVVPGSSSQWLQVHLYGGVIFLLLVLMHTGFRLPHGRLSWTLWLLAGWVVLGGLVGALIQRWIPRILTSGLAIEAHYDRIPELVKNIRERGESIVEGSGDALRRFYERDLKKDLEAPRARPIFCVDITGGIRARMRGFTYLERILPEADKIKLGELAQLFKTKLGLDAHYTLQKLLRWWLYGHVPFALLLGILVLIHVFAALYY